MSGYPNPHSGHGYGSAPPTAPPYGASPYAPSGPTNPYGQTTNPYGQTTNPYGAPPTGSASAPYGAPPTGSASAPYGAPPTGSASSPYGAPPTGSASSPYGAPATGSASAPYGAPPTGSPYSSSGGQHQKPYGQSPPPAGGVGGYAPPPSSASYPSNPFSSLLPSTFPPGTDPNIVACFQIADQDGSGLIDDKELQRALSSYNQSFSMRTVHLLMYHFTNTNTRKIGPKEFTALFYSLQNWRAIFERFDKDRTGNIDIGELRDALLSLGFSVSPAVLDLLVCKFDKTGGKRRAIEYDNFIECCLTVKGLTEKFKEKDTSYSGSATFSYESFMLTVLPFLIA